MKHREPFRETFWELTDVKIIDNNLKPEARSKPIKMNQLDIRTSLTNEQITDSFADPRVISIYSIKQFISRLETSGYTATRHKLFLTELAKADVLFGYVANSSCVFYLGQRENLREV